MSHEFGTKLIFNLYIPIWFYFNTTVDTDDTVYNGLYIPIWFYFNKNILGESTFKHNFTFQYGSTLIKCSSFFFQTVILYIPIWFYFNKIVLNPMKSFMYLYIPIWFYFNEAIALQHVQMTVLYIPIWFYFNRECYDLQESQSALHSNMVLL